MANDPVVSSRVQSRPRPHLFLAISQDNPYAQLGVSPTAQTEEINALIDQRRGEANKRLKAKGGRVADDPDERLIRELDQIGELIGDDRRRAAYDAAHPQNVLLTVQPGSVEQTMRRHSRAGLVSEWLLETAGPDAMLPTPRCRRLWAPSGADPAILEILNALAQGTAAASAPEDSRISLRDLDNVTKGE
ncbi:MAG: hypothetical protein WDM86_00325 [Rhizomicrobium sp.]